MEGLRLGAPRTTTHHCTPTTAARVIASQANLPFFFCSGSDFVEMFVGRGAARVRELFERARKQAPSMIFIDELDALGKVCMPEEPCKRAKRAL